jgi:hypothetical protein
MLHLLSLLTAMAATGPVAVEETHELRLYVEGMS